MSINRHQALGSHQLADLPAWTWAELPSASPASAPAGSGDVIDGKYLLGDCIAYGGMGVVFAATHLDLDLPVAVKCIRSELAEDPVIGARFLNEARSVARLRNEHVARVLDFGKLPAGEPYMVMEWLEGADLATILATHGPLSVAEAVDYVLQACAALAEAHASGIVHRDIKPENLFVTHGVDGVPIIKVLDFGVSKQLAAGKRGRSLTNPSRGVGSPTYMSPEQIRNAQLVDARTDIWSIGVVLYELLTGKLPFDGEAIPEICAHVLCDPPRSLCEERPELPEDLDAVVRRCLQKDLASRFSDIAELALALERLETNARTTAASIERTLGGAERASALPQLARPRDAARRSTEPSLLAAESPPDSGQTPPPVEAPVTVHAPIGRIPGERPIWPVALFCVAALSAAALTGAHRIGYDVRSGLRVIPIGPELGADALGRVPLTREFRPWIAPLHAAARAETELEIRPTLPHSARRTTASEQRAADAQSTDTATDDSSSEAVPVESSLTAEAHAKARPKEASEHSPYD